MHIIVPLCIFLTCQRPLTTLARVANSGNVILKSNNSITISTSKKKKYIFKLISKRFQNRFSSSQGGPQDEMMNYNELFGFDNTFIRQTFTEYLSCSKHPVKYWRAKVGLWEQMTHWLTRGLSTPVCSKIQWQARLGSSRATSPQSSHHIWSLTL